MEERFAVVGLGYVGLPVALAFARRFPGTIGFDINEARVDALRRGVDDTREVDPGDLADTNLEVTTDARRLSEATFVIVAVPTPIDAQHAPDLSPVLRASETVGTNLRRGAVVVYESTVYPGVTEDICGPLLERTSGMKRGPDFTLGYSPERINPGDKEHRFDTIRKLVSGEDAATLERVAAAYSSVVSAGVFRAGSIRVAEAAKAIENTQRDINIALMNEIAVICDRIGLRTHEVLEAAATKWNFLRFEPGLVGGHCIGVDPYYLTTLAESVGYHPQVILAGRRVNEGMSAFIAQRLVKMLLSADIAVRNSRVGLLGLAFKPDVPDLRNTKVTGIIHELHEFGIDAIVHDPLVSAEEAWQEYEVRLQPWQELHNLDAVILAVPHRELLARPVDELLASVRKGGVVVDVKSVLDPARLRADLHYWSL